MIYHIIYDYVLLPVFFTLSCRSMQWSFLSPCSNDKDVHSLKTFFVQFRCCGVHGEADWKGNVPISCCTKDPCNTLSHANWQEVTLLFFNKHLVLKIISKQTHNGPS